MQQICHFTARSGPFRCGKEVPAISRIPEPWHDAAMAFSLDLARDSDNFPKKVLALFDAASSSPITTRPFPGARPGG